MPKYQKVNKTKQIQQADISQTSNYPHPKLIKNSFSFQEQKKIVNIKSAEFQQLPLNFNQLELKKLKQEINTKDIRAQSKMQLQNFSQSIQNIGALLLEVTKSIIHPSVILINSKDKTNTQELLSQHLHSKQDKSVFLCQKISNYLNILDSVQQNFLIYEMEKSASLQSQKDEIAFNSSLLNLRKVQKQVMQKDYNDQIKQKEPNYPRFLKQNEENIKIQRDKSISKLQKIVKNDAKLVIDDQGAFKNVNIFPIFNKNQSRTPSNNSKFTVSEQSQKNKTKLSEFSSISKNNSKNKSRSQFQQNQTNNFSSYDGKKQKYQSNLSKKQVLENKQMSRLKEVQSRGNRTKQIDIDLTDNLIWKTVNQTNKFQKMLKMVESKSPK